MGMQEGGKRRHIRRGAYVVFILIVGTLVFLIVVAYTLPKSGDTLELQEAIKEGRLEKEARSAEFEKARESALPNGILNKEWRFSSLLEWCNGPTFRATQLLVTSCVETPGELTEANLKRIRQLARDDLFRHANNPFLFPVDLATCSRQDMLDRLCPYLLNLRALVEIEAGLKLGLCSEALNVYHNPRKANMVGVATFFAGRASCEVLGGESTRAADTLISGYTLAAMLAEWPHIYGQVERNLADKTLDLVLWRLADAGPLDQAVQDRILAALETRKPNDPLAKAFRLNAARIEIGEESDSRGYPKPVDIGFAFTGRGAFTLSKLIIPLLDRPPWQTSAQLGPIRQHRIAGYWANKFSDSAIVSYKQHAREALSADIARLAFALKAWKREHGAYPQTLSELTPFPLPQIPREPLSGEPVKYENSGQTFIFSGPADADVDANQYWVARN